MRTAKRKLVSLIRNQLFQRRDALLRVFPKSEKDQTFLQKFDHLSVNAQVWGLPLNPNVPVFVYVKSGSMHRVEKILEGRNITFTVLIEDIQRYFSTNSLFHSVYIQFKNALFSLIDREVQSLEERRANKDEEASDGFDFETYHPLDEVSGKNIYLTMRIL